VPRRGSRDDVCVDVGAVFLLVGVILAVAFRPAIAAAGMTLRDRSGRLTRGEPSMCADPIHGALGAYGSLSTTGRRWTSRVAGSCELLRRVRQLTGGEPTISDPLLTVVRKRQSVLDS
jgi:hypothetical protein